jgi:curved DNA-binding protein CbpA
MRAVNPGQTLALRRRESASHATAQRVREAYETLADPERRRRYDRQLRASRSQPVVIREVIVSGPFPEPLSSSRRDSFPSRIPVTATQSLFDQIVEEFFASFDDDLFWPRRWRQSVAASNRPLAVRDRKRSVVAKHQPTDMGRPVMRGTRVFGSACAVKR